VRVYPYKKALNKTSFSSEADLKLSFSSV